MLHTKNSILLSLALMAAVPHVALCSENPQDPTIPTNTTSTTTTATTPKTFPPNNDNFTNKINEFNKTIIGDVEKLGTAFEKQTEKVQELLRQKTLLKKDEDNLTRRKEALKNDQTEYNAGRAIAANIGDHAMKGVEIALGKLLSKPLITQIDRHLNATFPLQQETLALLLSQLAFIDANIDALGKMMTIKKQFLPEKDMSAFAQEMKKEVEKLEALRQTTQKRFEDLQAKA